MHTHVHRISLFTAILIAAGFSAAALEVSAALGYENRGASGSAVCYYTGASGETAAMSFRTDLSCDLYSFQLARSRVADFRSVLVEAGTGSFLEGPVDVRVRFQFERFSSSFAALTSIIPYIAFDTRFFFLSAGCNFRTFSMDDGDVFRPWFTRLEKQFTFSIGGRCWPRKDLSVSIGMNNYDAYATGNYASIRYEASAKLSLEPVAITAVLGYRPAGSIALSAAPSGFVVRLGASKTL